MGACQSCCLLTGWAIFFPNSAWISTLLHSTSQKISDEWSVPSDIGELGCAHFHVRVSRLLRILWQSHKITYFCKLLFIKKKKKWARGSLCVLRLSVVPKTLCDPMDHRSPGSSVHGISLARILDWAVISSSRDWTCVSCVSCISSEFFMTVPPGKLVDILVIW